MNLLLNLQPAVGIYDKFNISDLNTPNQEQIDRYLLEKSCQYNSLYGFITFLNKEYDLSLVYIKPRKIEIDKANRKKTEKAILELGCKSKPLSKKDELLWYQLCMTYFHKVNITLKQLKSLGIKEGNNEMLIIPYHNQDFWIPRSN